MAWRQKNPIYFWIKPSMVLTQKTNMEIQAREITVICVAVNAEGDDRIKTALN